LCFYDKEEAISTCGRSAYALVAFKVAKWQVGVDKKIKQDFYF